MACGFINRRSTLRHIPLKPETMVTRVRMALFLKGELQGSG